MDGIIKDISSSFGQIDIEKIISDIKTKPPEDRSNFESQIIDLYQKANEKGTEFCAQKLKEKAAENFRSNYLVYLALLAVIAYFIFRNTSK